MNHLVVKQQIAAALAGRRGWEQHPQQDHHFRHPETDVHILVYARELIVAFGQHPGERYDKAVGARTGYFPGLAIASVLEVADALVQTRLVAAWRAEVAAAFEKAFVAGEEPGPGPG